MLTKEMIYKKTPQQLTALLYEAGLVQFEKAQGFLTSKEYIEANRSMQKISDILHRLGAGLNYEAGIVADQLDAVYNYIADIVIEANMKKDSALLHEAKELFQLLADAWNQSIKAAPAKPEINKQKVAYEQNVMTENRPLSRAIETGN